MFFSESVKLNYQILEVALCNPKEANDLPYSKRKFMYFQNQRKLNYKRILEMALCKPKEANYLPYTNGKLKKNHIHFQHQQNSKLSVDIGINCFEQETADYLFHFKDKNYKLYINLQNLKL